MSAISLVVILSAMSYIGHQIIDSNVNSSPANKVFSDIIDAVEKGQYALLSLLDLSATFDIEDHEVLLRRLYSSFQLDSFALHLFGSHLEDRTQSVLLDYIFTTPSCVLYGVPQGSVLGPILFTLYTADLKNIIELFRLHSIDDSEFILPHGAVKVSTLVRDLGAYLDQAMTLQDHVSRMVSSCFYQL